MNRKRRKPKSEYYQGFTIEQLTTGRFSISLAQIDLFGEPFIHKFRRSWRTMEAARLAVDRLRRSLQGEIA